LENNIFFPIGKYGIAKTSFNTKGFRREIWAGSQYYLQCLYFGKSGRDTVATDLQQSGQETTRFDVAVIGAGIAGASIAAELSSHSRVLVLEQESQPGYHTTGRSAAIFAETYGPPPIRALTRASAEFFLNPPAGFSDSKLLSDRGVVMLAREDQLDQLAELIAEISKHGSILRLKQQALQQMLPLLRSGYASAGMYDPGAKDIDVHALHHGYLRQVKENGGKVWTNASVEGLSRTSNGWALNTRAGEIEADIVVNAAGAWADELGRLAGGQEIGLVPKRRTVAIIAGPSGKAIDDMPLVVDIDEQFYLKPDAGRLLISPADETPSPPCDTQPEEIDIAICADRIEKAFDLQIGRIENKWAGLRSFVADKCPVVGFDTQCKGLFWLAGQGGYGIQSAPALARLAASLVLDRAIPQDILDQGLAVHDISPQRLVVTT
jgi:D-arginine dehydrogenase